MKPNQPRYPENTVVNPSAILADAIRQDYNHVMDWLWVAEKVTTDNEREYCLRRALYIDPTSTRVQLAVRNMRKKKTKNKLHNWMYRSDGYGAFG